jgi:hypothetical protein
VTNQSIQPASRVAGRDLVNSLLLDISERQKSIKEVSRWLSAIGRVGVEYVARFRAGTRNQGSEVTVAVKDDLIIYLSPPLELFL